MGFFVSGVYFFQLNLFFASIKYHQLKLRLATLLTFLHDDEHQEARFSLFMLVGCRLINQTHIGENDMAGKFELYKDKAGEFRFRLKSASGDNLGSSEGYKAKSSAKNGIKSVKTNSKLKKRYDVFAGKSGKWFFNVKAGNHQVVLSSKGYPSQAAAGKACDAVKKAAGAAKIVEA